MSDIFKEVDEDIRREQLKRYWDRYGIYVIGLAVLIIAGTAGYRGWEYWHQRQAQASGDSFVAAIQLSEDGKHEEAIAALQAIKSEGSGGYPALAGFRIASELAAAGDQAGAVAEYEAISAASGTPQLIRDLARLRAALIMVDSASVADLEERIGDLTSTGNPWRHIARETLGLAAWRTNDLSTARDYFTQINDDQESPQDMRQRSEVLLAVINASQATPEPAGNSEG
jgi:hypothetical protein